MVSTPSQRAADILKVAESVEKRFQQGRRVLSFEEYLELFTTNPRRYARDASRYVRDVFDHSVADTARALELTESTVKTTHHRARKLIEAYDKRRIPFTPPAPTAHPGRPRVLLRSDRQRRHRCPHPAAPR